MAPEWDRLRIECGTAVKVQYKMGGLLPSWKHYQDAAHSITRPAQMGPEWMQAAHLSGVPINSRIWITDPPASSYPACIAVKSAQLQSEAYGEKLLRLLRQAVMLEGRNIARNDVLMDAAWLLHDEYHDFNLFRFRDDLMGVAGKEALKKDLQDAKYLGITRFPTLVVRRNDRSTVMLAGYQTYASLRACIGGKEEAST